jgi:hypothetical protein
MSYLNSYRNIFGFNKKISKGGIMPHNDPKDFKVVTNNRYIPYLNHQAWYFSGQSYEYHTNLKHMQYRGLSGVLMHWFKQYILKFLAPIFIILYLKGVSHDTRNYYVKGLSLYEGPNRVEHNMLTQFKKEKELFFNNRNTDFLGRRGADFYVSEGFVVTKTKRCENREKLLESLVELEKK